MKIWEVKSLVMLAYPLCEHNIAMMLWKLSPMKIADLQYEKSGVSWLR